MSSCPAKDDKKLIFSADARAPAAAVRPDDRSPRPRAAEAPLQRPSSAAHFLRGPPSSAFVEHVAPATWPPIFASAIGAERAAAERAPPAPSCRRYRTAFFAAGAMEEYVLFRMRTPIYEEEEGKWSGAEEERGATPSFFSARDALSRKWHARARVAPRRWRARRWRGVASWRRRALL